MPDKTSKFGGTSLADATAIRQAAAILDADSSRRFIVPSAPGKRTADNKKVTDLLIGWHHLLADELDPAQPVSIIRKRFNDLVNELGVDFDVEDALAKIDAEARDYASSDFLASRGEFLIAQILSRYLGATFVEPAECICFDFQGRLLPETFDLLAAKLKGPGRFVIPGFYGADPKGRIRVFSRGGSDVTGAIVARASDSALYENWTDVSGFRMTDPRIVPHARRIDWITYAELRELSYMGATVLHDEAIFPVRSVGIPINIRNTREPENPGTMIVPARVAREPVRGIAARSGFTMFNIEKTLMNKEVGFALKLLRIFYDLGVSFEHMPTGIDTISIIVKDEFLDDHADTILQTIEHDCEPDRVTIAPGLALIATVGQGMSHHVGVAARLCQALATARINIRVIDQGSSETNIIVGVEDRDMEGAVRAIYDAFENWNA